MPPLGPSGPCGESIQILLSDSHLSGKADSIQLFWSWPGAQAFLAIPMVPQAQEAPGGHWALESILGRHPCGERVYVWIKDRFQIFPWQKLLLDIKTEQRLFTATRGRRGGGSVQPGDARWTRRSWVKKGRWGNAKYGPGVQSMLLPGGPLTVMPGGPRRPRSPFISSYWIPSRPTWGKVLENYIWVPDTNCNSWLGGFWNCKWKTKLVLEKWKDFLPSGHCFHVPAPPPIGRRVRGFSWNSAKTWCKNFVTEKRIWKIS